MTALIVAAAIALLLTHAVAYRVGVGRERERGRVAVRLAAHVADEAETSGAIRRRLAQAHADAEQPPHVSQDLTAARDHAARLEAERAHIVDGGDL